MSASMSPASMPPSAATPKSRTVAPQSSSPGTTPSSSAKSSASSTSSTAERLMLSIRSRRPPSYKGIRVAGGLLPAPGLAAEGGFDRVDLLGGRLVAGPLVVDLQDGAHA